MFAASAVDTYPKPFVKLLFSGIYLADLGVYSKEFAEKIAPSAGLRNALVHDYNNIDKDILHKSIGEAIKEFNEYGKYIFAFCERIPESAG